MSKLKEDYEKSVWGKFESWVNGTFDEEAAQGYDKEDSSSHDNLSHKDEENNSKINQSGNNFATRYVNVYDKLYRVASIVVCLIIIGTLLYTVSFLPPIGDPNVPDNNEVAKRYIEQGMQETGAVNIVTGMILDYRAFDTFGESNVLYISAITVLILLRLDSNGKKKSKEQEEVERDEKIYEPKNDVILQRIATILFPPILLFGIYVILNGHLSPGGGFSGGAIIGAGLILYLNAFGFEKTQRFFTMKTFKAVSFGALLFYALSKSYSFFTGANHLESGIPLGTPGNILSAGLILPLNICVGLVVAVTMYGIFALFRKGGM